MKLFSILLIAYIFLLCGFPCKDECTISSTECISSQHTDDVSSCQDEQQKCHSCSPFCFCNCCHVNTITTIAAVYQVMQNVYQEHNIIYIEKKIDLFQTNIWHPPQNLS